MIQNEKDAFFAQYAHCAEEWVLEIIWEAKQTRATRLDLGNCGLTELPDALFELTWLEELILSNYWHEYSIETKEWESYKTQNEGVANEVKFINSNIKKLKKLKKLVAYGDQDAIWDLSDLSPLKELHNLQLLDISCTQVTNLSILKELGSLESLSFYSTMVSDLSPLKELYNLQSLDISVTQVIDLSPLKELSDLQSLNIAATQVSDLSSLKKIITLELLDISDSQVIDLSPLKELSNLQHLNISNTEVRDLYPLINLGKLQFLDISETQVFDLTPLKGLTYLQYLDFSLTEVIDLTPLKGLIELEQLIFTETQVDELDPLKNLIKLEVLNMHETFVSNLSPLKALTNLQYLRFSETYVDSLVPLTNLTQLQMVDAKECQISDLSPIENLLQLKDLCIRATEVTDLSPLRNLKSLESIDAMGTNTYDLNPFKNLKTLFSLNISATKVIDLSPLKNLIKLKSISVSQTLVIDLKPLKSLINLEYLNASYSQVSDLSPLKSLSNLESLNVSYSQVSDLSPLKELNDLQSLNVSNSQVSDPTPLKELSSLKSLTILDNPILYVPKEIYDQYECLDELKAYWQDLEQSQTTQNNQLKIMFLGNGCVGKTTLLHWFLDNAFKDLSLEDGRTHGIIIQPYTFKDSDVLAHFWDFGGQEVYHATHRLFLGRRSLYLLVWATESPDATHEERHPPQYWLDMIADIGGNERSRVLIVQNLFDGQTERNILTDAERQDYEKRGLDITTYCINAKTGVKIKSLKSAIEEEAEQLLKTNIEELPTSWVNIRKAVADKRLAKDKTLARADFENICRDCGLTTDPSVILGYLHRAGELFHYDNQFDNQIILDQEWALKAVYAVLKRDRIERYKGVFTFEDLRDFWQKENPNLTDDEAKIFLNFMLANKTMFYTEGSDNERGNNPEFVVPQLLPTTEPNRYRTWQRITDKTRHRIQYAFLHRDIIERFIVATAHLSKNKDYWRNGLFIEYAQDEAMIEVVNDAQDDKIKYIHIECTGTTQTELLKTIREEFNKIRTLDKAKEYRYKNGDWEQITGEMSFRAEDMGGFKEKAPIFEINKKKPISLQSTTENSMKQYLIDLLTEGKLKEVFAEIKKFADTQSSYFTDPLVLLQSRFNRNERDNQNGLLDSREYKIERNRIENSVKSLIDSEFDEGKAPAPPKIELKPTPEPKKQSNTEGNKPKVYFSYAWGDENETGESREKIVHELYESLKADGFDVVRDKEDTQYKDMISEFMKEIGRGDSIVIAISDKYLKSPNCMFEMYEIFRNSKLDKGAFREKIFPIRVESIRLSDPMVLDTYFEHWEQQEKDWEALIIKRGTRISPVQQERYKRIKAIASELGDFLDFLSDINTKTRVELSKNNFEEIKKAIVAKANG